MDAELKRRVDALRRPLELAAADNFAGVRRVQGLGHALRAACDGIIAKLDSEALTQWRVTLGKWEQLDEGQQQVEVARGMRLLARFPRPTAPVGRMDPRSSIVPPRRPLPAATRDGVGTGTAAAAGTGVGTGPARSHLDAVGSRDDISARNQVDRPGARRSAMTDAATSSTVGSRDSNTARNQVDADGARTSSKSGSRDNITAENQVDSAGACDVAAGKRARAVSVPEARIVPGGDGSVPPQAKRTRAASVPDATLGADAAAPAKAKRTRAASIPDEPIDPLAAPTHSLPGIGPTFAQKLAEKGLATVEDLLWMVPRRYDDVRDAKSLTEVEQLADGTRATFVAKVTSARMIFARGRRWAEVRLVDPGSGTSSFAAALGAPTSAVVRWFNVFAGIDKRMPIDCTVALSGMVKRRGGRLEFANPDILGIEIDGVQGKGPPAIIARYPDIPGVPPSRLRFACATACARVGSAVDDGVPSMIEVAAGMPSLADTLTQLHSPPADITPDDLAAMNRGDSRWQRRLAFGELFALGVAITLRRRERKGDAAVPCARAKELPALIDRALPFTLTKAQRRSIDEIAGDLAASEPMNRLLQGDVGAGKTAVAFAAALQAARAGRQTAVMAPTELLAEQHMETWKKWAQVAKVRLELLTASTPKGVRQSLLALLAGGQIDILIGTHSLLAEGVGFHGLGLVIIDEQHRFGVAQRAKLRDKGDGQGAPHLLVMTATPIPRTLALTAYGDLDVSVLDELPPGRQPVATKQLPGARGQTAAYKLVEERVAAGERVYVVCPKVEPSDGDDEGSRDWADATTTSTELAKVLPRARVGLVHGRLEAMQRDRVMRAFKQGELDVLVATTVIEVGVDVPAATVMVIHDADRFGLAQLHQLRGRVGRGGGASHCLLLSQGTLGPDAEERLGAMVQTNDGFVIAEKDLLLRGEGELLGPRQAGVPRLRFGDLQQHTQLLLEARALAERILDEDPRLVEPQHAALRRAIDRRFAQHVYGAESG